MSSESRDAERRERIHSRLDDGALPVELSRRIFAGYALGNRVCAGCCEPILQNEIEYEVQSPTRRPMHFHLKCHVLWQVECVRRLKDEPTDA
jgi:hypothetical protein